MVVLVFDFGGSSNVLLCEDHAPANADHVDRTAGACDACLEETDVA